MAAKTSSVQATNSAAKIVSLLAPQFRQRMLLRYSQHALRQRMLLRCKQLNFGSESQIRCTQYNFGSESQFRCRTHNSAVNHNFTVENTIRQLILIRYRQLSFDRESQIRCNQLNFGSDSQIRCRTHDSVANAY